jgi:hypothetical protein
MLGVGLVSENKPYEAHAGWANLCQLLNAGSIRYSHLIKTRLEVKHIMLM